MLYWLFAAILAGGALFMKKEHHPQPARRADAVTGQAWHPDEPLMDGFFLFMGCANLAQMTYNFSTDTWVDFKLFGGMGLILVLRVLAQG